MLKHAQIRGGRNRLGARLRDERGFTLIELLTTMLMLGIGLTAAFFFYSSAVGRTTDTEERVQTLADVRNLGERMARDVRESYMICPPLPSSSANVLYLSGPQPLSSASTPTSCVASQMITWDCGSTAGTCTRRVGSGTPQILGEDLDTSTPIFTKTANNYVSIYLSKVPEGRTAAVTFERGAALRNYCSTGSC